ncbi:MAG: sulfatase-like hydrolase/transferase [Vicinamibacterales bacterium]
MAAGAIVVVLAVVAVAWWRGARPASPGAVVLISIDTLRADHLPVYGYTKGQTPAIDALAKDGVVFDHAYSHAPQTLPAHTSILTGLLPFESGVRDNLGFTLAPDKKTLAERLRPAGYKTGGFVSAYVLRAETGINRGFDVYNADLPAAASDVSPGQVQRPGEQTLGAAEAWLNTLAGDRFFLFFHIYEPHTPYTPPSRFSALAPYDGEIAYADEIAGKLIADLKRRGWYDRATIVLLSDHGEGLGDHGEFEHGLFVYDETIHVPWIMKLPGERSAGRRVADPIQHIDLVPTLATIAGLARPEGLRGRDLGPALLATGHPAAQGIYSEALYPRYHFGWSELLALTDERYKFIKAPHDELYDLQNDPHERTNIVSDRAQTASGMRSGLDALVAGRDIDAPSAVSAEDRERLAALGYVGTQFSAGAAGSGTSLPDPKDMAPVLKKYREAVTLLDQRNFSESADRLRDIVKTNPGMTDVWVQYAVVLTRLGRQAEALDAYKQVIRLKPEEPSGLLGAAATLLALGRFDEARAHAELAIKPAPASAHQTLANIALAKKDYAEARRQADLAAAADPTLPMPVFIRGMIEYTQGHYTEALPFLTEARDKWAARTMQPADLRFYIGDSFARLERYPDAERAFREELAIYPNSMRARSGLAMLYASTNRPDDVERVIADMLKVSPSPAAYQAAAQLWDMFGQTDRAAAVRAEARAKFGR